jgi:hypothetical protein
MMCYFIYREEETHKLKTLLSLNLECIPQQGNCIVFNRKSYTVKQVTLDANHVNYVIKIERINKNVVELKPQ